jgi:hypothetical protein
MVSGLSLQLAATLHRAPETGPCCSEEAPGRTPPPSLLMLGAATRAHSLSPEMLP